MNTEERPQVPEESQKTSLEEAQEAPEEIESESPGCDGSGSHKWANTMEVQNRLSGKPDLEINETHEATGCVEQPKPPAKKKTT